MKIRAKKTAYLIIGYRPCVPFKNTMRIVLTEVIQPDGTLTREWHGEWFRYMIRVSLRQSAIPVEFDFVEPFPRSHGIDKLGLHRFDKVKQAGRSG
jgi:hypothetical protein